MRNQTWRISGTGEIELNNEEIYEPQTGEVLVRVKAISLNYRDLLIIDDGIADDQMERTIPISDGAGVIVAVGNGVQGWGVGDRVVPNFFLNWLNGRYSPAYRQSALGASTPGLAREYVVVPSAALVRIPEYLSFEQAATLPCAGVTAWSALMKGKPVSPGEAVLIQGTGGVSIFALQLAKSLGARVIALTSSGERELLACQLGADVTLNYRDIPDWSERVLNLTGGEGVHKVVEVIGNAALKQSFKALASEGEIAYIGCLGGFDGEVDPMQLLYKNASLRGVYVGSRQDLEDLCLHLEQKRIAPKVGMVYSFQELPKALSAMRHQQHSGKIVVQVDGDGVSDRCVG